MFKRRRDAFLQAIGSGVALIPSAPVAHRTADQDYAYRQDSDFYYLTGFNEPSSLLLLAPNHPEHQVVLFVQPRDKEKEIWNGRRSGTEGALRDYGVDAAYLISEIDEVVPRFLDNQSTLYFRLGGSSEWDERVIDWVKAYRSKTRLGIKGPTTLCDPAEILHEMRLIKSEDELEIMRRSAMIAAAAHCEAMKAVKPGMFEYELQAILDYTFRRRGASGPSYSSIVGGGVNACILHYVENNAPLQDGDMVLIDAGADLGYYASDITRSFPVNGCFTPAQKALYEVVLEANKEAIAMIKPGVRYQEMHEKAVQILTKGLVRLGILHGEVDELIASEAYKPFFMHKTGHWLGLDVHDVGQYKVNGEWRPLEPGMVLTIEPGLYVAAESAGVPSEYWNIGIRIEDDVVVTATGHEVLTSGVPKEVNAIEALMQQPVNA